MHGAALARLRASVLDLDPSEPLRIEHFRSSEDRDARPSCRLAAPTASPIWAWFSCGMASTRRRSAC